MPHHKLANNNSLNQKIADTVTIMHVAIAAATVHTAIGNRKANQQDKCKLVKTICHLRKKVMKPRTHHHNQNGRFMRPFF
jgi:hypothetical protein